MWIESASKVAFLFGIFSLSGSGATLEVGASNTFQGVAFFFDVTMNRRKNVMDEFGVAD